MATFHRIQKLPIALLILLLSVGSAQAIVMRHDTGFGTYLARESDYPAVFYLEQRRQRKVCVATLIDSRWAITAAHCLSDTPLLEQLKAGKTWPVSIAGQAVQIEAAWIHPHYPEPPRDFLPDVDLALLALDRHLSYPRAIPINRVPDEEGRQVTFLGWGFHAVGIGGPYRDDGRFRRARNTVVEAGARLHFHFDDPREPDSAALRLEGLPGQGDSGGPALIAEEEHFRLAGVAVGELSRLSDGEPPQRQGIYGAEVIYERVARHQHWIDAVMDGQFKATAAAAGHAGVDP